MMNISPEAKAAAKRLIESLPPRAASIPSYLEISERMNFGVRYQFGSPEYQYYYGQISLDEYLALMRDEVV